MKEIKKQVQFDKLKAGKNLEEINDKLRREADPVLLNEYRRLFKKEISLFRRSWAAAWLFMYYDNKETPRIKSGSGKKPSNVREEKSPAPEVESTLPEEESKRLFVSIGKNRRLYPREVITLILSKTSASREDIGVIRILDNFSFVQVRDTRADEIIKALSGIRFRGRTLAVNYAKPRAEE